MTRGFIFAIVATILFCATCAHAQAPNAADSRGKTCRMEQQCHWENFQKHCVWVKVCR
jgi:hypothetical protein